AANNTIHNFHPLCSFITPIDRALFWNPSTPLPLRLPLFLIYSNLLRNNLLPIRRFRVVEILNDLFFGLGQGERSQILSVPGEDEPSGFLRNSQNQGICVFGYAHCCPMPETKVCREVVVLADRKHAACRFDSSFINNDSTVVVRTCFVKNGDQQSFVDFRIERVTGLRIKLQL